MYGLKELDKNENNEEDDHSSFSSSKSSLKCCDPNKTCRHNLQNLLHSYRFHLIIVGLVILDCLIVIIELLIDLQIYQSEVKSQGSNHTQSADDSHSGAHTIAEILHYLSIGILCIFTTEIILKLYAFRIQFFSHKAEVFDAFIVITSLTLDIVFIKHEDVLRFLGLVIILRLWRIIRVVHGIILSVKTPLEHSFEKEKKLREKLEKELGEMHLYINSLEIEITTLRALIKRNGIVNDVPQTYLKIDRKV